MKCFQAKWQPAYQTENNHKCKYSSSAAYSTKIGSILEYCSVVFCRNCEPQVAPVKSIRVFKENCRWTTNSTNISVRGAKDAPCEEPPPTPPLSFPHCRTVATLSRMVCIESSHMQIQHMVSRTKVPGQQYCIKD